MEKAFAIAENWRPLLLCVEASLKFARQIASIGMAKNSTDM